MSTITVYLENFVTSVETGMERFGTTQILILARISNQTWLEKATVIEITPANPVVAFEAEVQAFLESTRTRPTFNPSVKCLPFT